MATSALTASYTAFFRPVGKPTALSKTELFESLIQYAALAPSSHNTQCWKFRVDDGDSSITVLPDLSRACPVVDPDNHHLYVSLGCAVENLVLAAAAHGYRSAVDSSHPPDGIRVDLTQDKASTLDAKDLALFEAIPKRQVSRCEYDGKPLSQDELSQLSAAGTGKGVRVLMVEEDLKNTMLDQIVRANTAQLTNPLFKSELGSWVRFNEKTAAAKGDGLYGKACGNPAAPNIIGNLIFKVVARPSIENAKLIKQYKSSAGFAIFVSEQDDAVHWVEVGRCYERFALKAVTLGVRNAMLNQPVEEKDPQLAQLLGLDKSERPDLLVRFGKGGPEMVMSPRRPVGDVLEYGTENDSESHKI